MKVLILGSLGFIGSNLIDYLKEKDCLIYGCDLTDNAAQHYTYQKVSILSADFDVLFRNEQFDLCINASGSGSVSYSISHPISDFESNTLTVAKVLDTIRKYAPACKYLHISSAAVYGNPTTLPICESEILKPLSPYGYHKVMSEQICQEYHSIFKVPVCIIRPFSVYGNGLKKQLLWDICEKLKQSNDVYLFGTGDESRDFIHITDLCSLIWILVTQTEFRSDIYNAASGVETSIAQIASIFKTMISPIKKIHFSGNAKKGDPVNWRADVTKVEKLHFKPVIPLLKGISEYKQWFNAQIN